MQLKVETGPSALTVQVLDDRIDAAAAIRFKERMREIARAGDRRIVLDLAQVRFLDSSGLGAIVAIKRLLGDCRVLELAALTPPVEKVFRLTRMDSVFVIHPTLDAALAHAAGA